jgi:tyrosine-protein kinase Etk/Wzc
MEVRDYLEVLVRRRGLVAMVLLASLGAAAAFMALSPRSWTSTATVRVEPASAAIGGQVHQDDISYLDRLVNTYAKLANSREVSDEVAKRLRLSSPPDVEVVSVPTTNLMQIKVTAGGAAIAGRAANAVASRLVEQVQNASAEASRAAEQAFLRRSRAVEGDIAQARAQLDSLRLPEDRELELRLRERVISGRAKLDAERQSFESYQAGREARAASVSVITPASVATMSGPGIEQVLAVALVLGLIAAVGLAFLAENLSGSFRSRAELEESVQSLVLAAIPRVPGRGRLSALTLPPSRVARRAVVRASSGTET